MQTKFEKHETWHGALIWASKVVKNWKGFVKVVTYAAYKMNIIDVLENKHTLENRFKNVLFKTLIGVLQRYSKKVPFLFAIIHNHIYAIHHNKQQMFNHFSWTDGSNEDNLNLQHYYVLTHTHFPSCYVIICTPYFWNTKVSYHA